MIHGSVSIKRVGGGGAEGNVSDEAVRKFPLIIK
jgi:hypothetical protein